MTLANYKVIVECLTLKFVENNRKSPLLLKCLLHMKEGYFRQTYGFKASLYKNVKIVLENLAT